MISRAAVTLGLAFLLSSPALSAEPESKNVAAIRAADQEWARVFAARDLDKSVGMCAEDGAVLAPNAPRATGREAIRSLFAGFFALPHFSISWQPSDVRVSRSGDMGYSTGTYKLGFTDPTGKAVSDQGKYGTVWHKQSDGSWRVLLDVFNSDLPLPTAAR